MDRNSLILNHVNELESGFVTDTGVLPFFFSLLLGLLIEGGLILHYANFINIFHLDLTYGVLGFWGYINFITKAFLINFFYK